MQIKITYIGIDKNGIQGVWCGFKPDDVTVTEERQILYPAEGKILHLKDTENNYKSVRLQNGDSEENYEEIEEIEVNE